MPFQKIQAEKLSDAVVRQIESLILQGILSPGDRLPSERDLSDQLGVSRPSLRDALGQLQDDGLLSARPGAGIFVADVLGNAFSPALTRLFASHDQAVFDYLDFRKDLEGMAAERAAQFASDTDLKVIDQAHARLADPAKCTPTQEAALDADFHMAICEASHNVVLLHMLRSMYDLLQQGVFYNRSNMFGHATTKAQILDQHKAINDALQARDPAGARTAVETHLDFVAVALRDQKRADANEAVAKLKFAKDD
ncbi:MAG: FadR/GntR family transcriptional regulator [Pseudomonadota bacterium]